MRPRIIGILGQSGSGKDTAADYLVHRYGYVKVALADPLKRICKEVYDFSDDQLWGPSASRNRPDPRFNSLSARVALQTLGTEWGRTCYEGTWIEYGLRVADEILNNPTKKYSQRWGIQDKGLRDFFTKAPVGIVIPDIRFMNEVTAIKAKKANAIIKIHRPGMDGNVGVTNHQSETEQKSIPHSVLDGYLSNEASLEQLYDIIDSIMVSLSMR